MYHTLIDSVVSERGFATEFSEHENAAATAAAAMPIAPDGRVDCRAQQLVTIDGEDAADFDDAVGCEAQPDGGWLLTVAIADVAAYVPADGALDAAARQRGNSVYLPDRVLPMLPEALSNGACSLKPRQDRLCLICQMRVDAHGDVLQYRFFRGLIHSARRLNYDEAANYMQNPADDSAPALLAPLWRLTQRFRAQRERRGAMLLEKPEKTCKITAAGKLVSPDMARNIAHWAIEEAMIAANRCAADFLIQRRRPALHRIHAKPNADKVRLLAETLHPLGIVMPAAPAAADFAAALEQAERQDLALSDALLPFVLGALSRAEYAPDEKTGHFGLACPRYTHFTSPIRRYPDLLTHRAIIAAIEGAPSPLPAEDLPAIGAHCGETEVSADKAGWDSRQRLLCVSAQALIGCEYEGYVSGMTGAGFFVTVPELGIDGMTRFSALPGYWRANTDKKTATSPNGEIVLTIASKVNVRLSAVVPEKGRVDFVPCSRLLAQ